MPTEVSLFGGAIAGRSHDYLRSGPTHRGTRPYIGEDLRESISAAGGDGGLCRIPPATDAGPDRPQKMTRRSVRASRDRLIHMPARGGRTGLLVARRHGVSRPAQLAFPVASHLGNAHQKNFR